MNNQQTSPEVIFKGMRGKKILFVDDDPNIHFLIQSFFEDSEVAITEVTSNKKGQKIEYSLSAKKKQRCFRKPE